MLLLRGCTLNNNIEQKKKRKHAIKGEVIDVVVP